MEFIRRYAYIFLGIACVIALGALYMFGRSGSTGVVDTGQALTPIVHTEHEPASEPISEPISEPSQTAGPQTIIVHIEGAVYSPGVKEVPYGSRINDVMLMAGGHTEEADLTRINLAAFAQDATLIIIPTIGEDLPEIAFGGQQAHENQSGQAAITADGLVNINLANLTELQTLPGIGPVIAQNIIDYRESHDGFSSIEELLNVNRIGQATLEQIRDRVTI